METIKSKVDFESLIKSNTFCVVHFYAPWAPQCENIDGVLEELIKLTEYKDVKFAKCEAEELADIALLYKITAVPTIIILNNGKPAEVINGAKAGEIREKLNKVIVDPTLNLSLNGESLETRLKALVKRSTVVVFMKGNPQQPRCGFSKTLISILNETKVKYDTFDILQDEEVRQGLKTFSNWPTYPQIYVKGELIGGLDIIKELHQSGELVAALQGQ